MNQLKPISAKAAMNRLIMLLIVGDGYYSNYPAPLNRFLDSPN